MNGSLFFSVSPRLADAIFSVERQFATALWAHVREVQPAFPFHFGASIKMPFLKKSVLPDEPFASGWTVRDSAETAQCLCLLKSSGGLLTPSFRPPAMLPLHEILSGAQTLSLAFRHRKTSSATGFRKELRGISCPDSPFFFVVGKVSLLKKSARLDERFALGWTVRDSAETAKYLCLLKFSTMISNLSRHASAARFPRKILSRTPARYGALWGALAGEVLVLSGLFLVGWTTKDSVETVQCLCLLKSSGGLSALSFCPPSWPPLHGILSGWKTFLSTFRPRKRFRLRLLACHFVAFSARILSSFSCHRQGPTHEKLGPPIKIASPNFCWVCVFQQRNAATLDFCCLGSV
ncbi:MAG: hypothetical protein PHW76_01795 [Alphaproteobacteria bacterium]|nr:hypothetical protein [Alphaproteobacteria bacterium]